MPPPEFWIAGVVMVSLVFYLLSGGADFGGGVWQLLAFGPRAARQRELISQAIAPIWEANHIWLIVALVLLFTAFPPAFSAISIALFLPIVFLLVGIVLRGSAFVFCRYGSREGRFQRRWSLVFSISSIIAPLMLGVIVGSIASGSLFSWFAPFPWLIGLLTLVLSAYLAAVYLTLETDDPALRRDFRLRAMAVAVAVGLVAVGGVLFSSEGAPRIHDGLCGRWWSIPFQMLVASTALAAFGSLWKGRFRLARVMAIIQVILIVAGWGLSQYPYLIVPDLTIAVAAAPPSVLRPLLIVLVVGSIVLFPSLGYLYNVFKWKQGRRR